MHLEVREVVREMRDRFKVVELGYFLSTLRERGLYSVEDISDALHFLTNIGELSYFGNVFPDKQKMDKMMDVSNGVLNFVFVSRSLLPPCSHCQTLNYSHHHALASAAMTRKIADPASSVSLSRMTTTTAMTWTTKKSTCF